MDKHDHPQFDGYDKGWQHKWRDLDKKGWAAGYDKVFRSDVKNRGWAHVSTENPNIHLSEVTAQVFQRIVRSKSVLDFGCGPGWLACGLLSKGVNVVGVDCSKEAIAFCKGHFHGNKAEHFSVGDVDAVKAIDAQFDSVVAVEVFAHLSDPEEALKVLWDRVKEGGQLLLSVPKDGRIPSPYHIRDYFYDDVADLSRIVAEVPGGVEYLSDITETTHEYLLVIRKEPLLIRYVQVQGRQELASAHDEIVSQGKVKSGVYNWSKIFNGHAARVDEINPDSFDIIHVQLGGDNFDAPRLLRDKIGEPGPDKARIVVNLDYAPEYWDSYPPYPDLLRFQLLCADYVFSQSEIGSSILSSILGRAVPTMPHPVDVAGIAKLSVPFKDRDLSQVAVIPHRDYNTTMPRYVFRDLGVVTHLIGYQEPQMGLGQTSQAQFAYSHVYPPASGEDYLKLLCSCSIAFDTYTHSTQGRATTELAALGIPTIGHRCVDAQRYCFAALTTDIHDVGAQRHQLERLLNDEGFYLAVSETAVKQVQTFNFERSKERFLRLIDHDRETYRPSGNGRARDDKGLAVLQETRKHTDATSVVLP